MKKLIVSMVMIGLLMGSANALLLGSKLVASSKKIINVSVLVANATTEVAMSSGTYIKNFKMVPRSNYVRFLDGSATTDAYVTLYPTFEYQSPVDVEIPAPKSFYVICPVVPTTLEVIYWYK